jgi:hypothetical protein
MVIEWTISIQTDVRVIRLDDTGAYRSFLMQLNNQTHLC